jgi:hypothetical protein
MHGSLIAHALPSLPPQFGRIVNVDIKRPARPPYFAFIEFSDDR